MMNVSWLDSRVRDLVKAAASQGMRYIIRYMRSHTCSHRSRYTLEHVRGEFHSRAVCAYGGDLFTSNDITIRKHARLILYANIMKQTRRTLPASECSLFANSAASPFSLTSTTKRGQNKLFIHAHFSFISIRLFFISNFRKKLLNGN